MNLIETIKYHKEKYRNGESEISDEEYDSLIHQLKKIDPKNELLNTVEEENFNREKVKHPFPMLSTEKVFSKEELQKWFNRIEKRFPNTFYRVTVKLDGMSGRYENGNLYTRGDGIYGFDITDAFKKGLKFNPNHQNDLIGEIVMLQDYFNKNLTEEYIHPRNVVVGAITCDELKPLQEKSLKDDAIHFIPYKNMKGWIGRSDEIIIKIDEIYSLLTSECLYPYDGLVIEVDYRHENIKKELGSTNHHHKWQVAYKVQGEKKKTIVNDIVWQVGKGGNITPVLEVEPIKVSGALISRVTGHNYGFLFKKGIGIGSEIEIIRSGEVIPKIVNNLTKKEIIFPKICPSCNSETILVKDILKCENENCVSQLLGKMKHFFKTLNVDLMGGKTIEKILNFNETHLHYSDEIKKIYFLSINDFIEMGFGKKQSENLYNSLLNSKNEKYEDWKVLSSLSISNFGKGDAKKIMKIHNITDLLNMNINDISEIDGFGEIKAISIFKGLKENYKFIKWFLENFNVIESISMIDLPLGKLEGNFVFTGKMNKSRDEMFSLCEQNGGVAQKSITKTTTYLVTGENVGQSKLTKAEKYGTRIITEKEFLRMINV